MPDSNSQLDELAPAIAAELTGLTAACWTAVRLHERAYELEQDPPRYRLSLYRSHQDAKLRAGIDWGIYPGTKDVTVNPSMFHRLFAGRPSTSPLAVASMSRPAKQIAADFHRRVVQPADELWPTVAEGVAEAQAIHDAWESFSAEFGTALGLEAKEDIFHSSGVRTFDWQQHTWRERYRLIQAGEAPQKASINAKVVRTSAPLPETTITIQLEDPAHVRMLVPALRFLMGALTPVEDTTEAALTEAA